MITVGGIYRDVTGTTKRNAKPVAPRVQTDGDPQIHSVPRLNSSNGCHCVVGCGAG